MGINRPIQTYIRYIVGVAITSLGVVLIYTANLGSAASSTFTQGLSNVLNIKTGSANILLNIAVFAFILLVDRKSIKIGALLSTFSFGLIINLWTPIITSVLIPTEFWFRVLVCVIGIVIEAYGLSYYMRADLGYGALELIADFFSKKLNISFAIAKSSMDFLFMVVGYLMGGVVGLGTVLATFTMGYMIELFLKRGKNEYEKI